MTCYQPAAIWMAVIATVLVIAGLAFLLWYAVTRPR